MKLRRVVTGHGDGRASIASDEAVDGIEVALAPGVAARRVVALVGAKRAG